MIQIFSQMTNVMQSLFEQLAQRKTNDSPVVEAARQKLISQLREIMKDVNNIGKLEDTTIIEEKLKTMMGVEQQGVDIMALIREMQIPTK